MTIDSWSPLLIIEDVEAIKQPKSKANTPLKNSRGNKLDIFVLGEKQWMMLVCFPAVGLSVPMFQNLTRQKIGEISQGMAPY